MDERVLEQYFRFSKPGCIFLFQSSFSLGDKEDILEKSSTKLMETLEKYSFSILEVKKSSAFRKHYIGDTILEEMEFRQLIALKPFKINTNKDTPKQENPHSKINIGLYRNPNPIEEYFGLQWAKVLSGQLKLVPQFSQDTLDSWLLAKTEGQKDTREAG